MPPSKVNVILAALGVAAVLGVIAYGIFRSEPATPPPDGVAAEPSDQTPPESTTTPESTARPATSRPRLSYGDAVRQYGERRISLNEECVATPGQVTFKNDTTVMFDSRSDGRRTITIDGRRYTLDGAGYVVVRLSAPTLPYTVKVDCGSGRNNAEILLQA